MNRRKYWKLLLLGGTVAGALFGQMLLRDAKPGPRHGRGDWQSRVYFVCCDDHGDYSPGVYVRVGGGQDAFDTVREAAPFMRASDPGSAAAGLCGFLFKQIGYDRDTGGTLSLEPPPRPGPDGKIDWKEYGGDGDVILINVDQGTAKCCFGSIEGQEVHDLRLGGQKLQRP